ncbi:PQQ-binding-like beta-propeller repeat protein [Paenibacillus albidus]|uniref:outer membrane protein assembly factor BamB family protein n=1 Tax=Paenibacillus albidus TaxID=2041023 RepID=UPI001BE6F2BA|nr:PQQ-binding-like beta-propeller repeat protein [Paenibacillus albidus]MBT2292290.1 PQQ-binding-like beta-propeller repeat protein [Paenibacillus albidus]
MLMGKNFKKLSCTVCAALMLPLGGGGEIAQAEEAAVRTSNIYYQQVDAPVVQPAWSLSIARPKVVDNLEPVTAIAENGKVFMMQPNGKLAALKAATGTKLWEFGSQLAQRMVYNNGSIYGMTSAGALYKVKEENGGKVWSAALSYGAADSITVTGGTVYVTQGQKMAAIDAATGKIKWRIAEDPNNYYYGSKPQEAEGVVVRNYAVSGAITVSLVAVYDKTTGTKLWEASRQQAPLVIKDGILYSERELFMLDDDPVNRKIRIAAFNLRTGTLKGERTYSWTDKASTDGVYHGGGSYSSAFLNGNDLYIHQGQRLALYDFRNYVTGAEPVKKWAQESYDQRTPLGLVHQDRIYFTDENSHGLIAMKLATGQYVRFDQGENDSVQSAVFGKGVYVGQSDGLLHAYDLMSTKPVFTVRTGSREFGPLLKTGDMLLIQSGGKLHGIKLPAALK